MAFNSKHISDVVGAFQKDDVDGAFALAKKYAGEELNRIAEVRDATQKFMRGKLEAEQLRMILAEYEKKIIKEFLEEVQKVMNEQS